MARVTKKNIDMNDHDLLIRLDEKLTEVLRRMDTQDSVLANLQGRVGSLENFRWWILGAAAAVGATVSYLISEIKI